MEKIVFDSGIKEFQVNNNGVLRFNPSDPNLYARFYDAAEQIRQIEKNLEEQGKTLEASEANGETVIRYLQEADKRAKELLGQVFGAENDFDKLLGGVNLLAVAGNGERVVTNLMQALLPIIENGAKLCADQKVDEAVQKANKSRAQRGSRQ